MRVAPLLFLLASVLPSTLLFGQGQNTSFNWKFEEASKLMEEKFFNQAAEIWSELVLADPENANLNWKLGFCYYSSYNQRHKALPYLERASQFRVSSSGTSTAGYDPFNPRERNAPIEVDYYLARSYHLNSELDKADILYRKFADQTDSRHQLQGQALRGLEQTANARELMASPLNYQVTNAGPNVNSDYPDYSPVVSVDGNALYYTSRRVRPDSSNFGFIDPVAGIPHEDIYVSFKDREGNWQPAELVPLKAEYKGHLAVVNVSADGQTLIVYKDDNGDGNLYESKLVGEVWSPPVLMGSDINTKSWETHGALSADGNTFYFISDRKGGYGGRDIYRVVRLPDGQWSKAQNLGPVVNTKFDEDGVFIHPDNRRLYFSSVGHNSMGGFDVFRTEQSEDGSWAPPRNLGFPMNSPDDEVFFITSADGRSGFFSSDKIGGFGEKDIYTVELPEAQESEGLAVLKGFIISPNGEPLPPSTILYVTDKTTGEVKTYKPRQRDGVYVAILPPCREYNLDYRVNDVTVHSEDIFVECESSYQEINKEIYLSPVSLAGAATIANLPAGTGPGAIPRKGADPKTDAQRKEEGLGRVPPDASYADEFAKFYAYNAKDIDPDDARWKQFIDVVVGLIDKNGEAKVVIEASASKVPTKTFGTNENLSRQRMEDARRRLVEAVRARGKDPNLLMLEAVNSLVQGPRYKGDYQDLDKYGRFQYAKLKVR